MFSDRRCEELKSRIVQSHRNLRHDSILLSGGLDSSILASIIRPDNAITIGLGLEAEDFYFASKIATLFCKRHVKVVLDEENLLRIIDKLISIMETFDPIEVRNSSVVYAGIEESLRRGYNGVITGDGCDELFAGYDYMRRLDGRPDELERELHRIWEIMRFSSHTIGQALGVAVSSPFLGDRFLEYSKVIDTSEKVGYYGGKRWGKFILRKCFEKDIGKDIAWRTKRALEAGANITMITSFIKGACSDELYRIETNKARNEGVFLRDKEHLYYYLMYRRRFPPPGARDKSCVRRCPKCLGPFVWKDSYCRTCGAYPIDVISR
jgi:asparagine synthase (glutamine-hydrolysing)